jgi:hypothetical protein
MTSDLRNVRVTEANSLYMGLKVPTRHDMRTGIAKLLKGNAIRTFLDLFLHYIWRRKSKLKKENEVEARIKRISYQTECNEALLLRDDVCFLIVHGSKHGTQFVDLFLCEDS